MAFWSWPKVIPKLSVHDTRHSWRRGTVVADFQTGVKAHEGDSEAGFARKAVLGETKVRPKVGQRRADRLWDIGLVLDSGCCHPVF